MRYSEEDLDRIFDSNDGACWICEKKLARKNYGQRGGKNAKGRWEVDHSVAQARGGTDHLNNLKPACPSCNRSKQDRTTRTARKHAPMSTRKEVRIRDENAGTGALLGALGGAALGAARGAAGGVFGALIGAAVGAAIGASIEPN